MNRLSSRRAPAIALVAGLIAALIAPAVPGSPLAGVARAADVPSGFNDELLFGGLDHPIGVQFASNGQVFVAEKRGRILRFDNLADTTPTVVVNVESNVHNFWDRGLLGFTINPNYPTDPAFYLLYTYNKSPLSSTVPRWVGGSVANDPCPAPPGATTNGCTVTGRLSKVTNGSETVLVEDWCQQFPSHSVGTVAFGPEGALYVSAGEGANFNATDYGQFGGSIPNNSGWTDPVTPVNPCADPSMEGGAVRAQDLRTGGDATGLGGTVIRVSPSTGAAWPTNGNIGPGDANSDRIIATGLRNPFRFTIRPGTDDLWIGDVGWEKWEEINELPVHTGAPRNFGWPCREGTAAQPGYAGANIPICQNLAAGDTTNPILAYEHGVQVAPGDDGACNSGGSSLSGLVFLPASSTYPASYDNALFFTDYSRGCIWFMPAGGDGRPNPAARALFADLRPSGTGGATYLTVTPSGDIAYADYDLGEIRRIHYYGPAVPPMASFTATPSSGPAPLLVQFNASGSSDPNGGTLTYAWDLDGDGAFDDATGVTTSRTYVAPVDVEVGLRVTDPTALSDTTTRTVSVGNTPPDATMSTPAASLKWKVGDKIAFAGNATDAQQGTLPASAFRWTLSVEHCPAGCHSHEIETRSGIKSGTFDAPDHEYPSHLKITLVVTDSGGLTDAVVREIQPQTSTVRLVSTPVSVPLTLGNKAGSPPPTTTVIVNGKISAGAPLVATVGGKGWEFVRWSDGKARVHDVVASASPTTYTATYAADAANACASATAGTPFSSWKTGRLSPGDTDWYRVNVTTAGKLRIVLGDLGTTARLDVYRNCTPLIRSSNRAGTSTEELIVAVAPGTYAIKVTGQGKDPLPTYLLKAGTLKASAHVLTSRAIVSGANLRLVGEVMNNTSSYRGPARVTARLYNAQGTLLSTRTVTTDLTVLAPGARVPFRINGSRPAGYHHVSYTVSAPVTLTRPLVPAITSWAPSRDAQGRYVVSGTLKAGSITAKSVRIGVLLYDRRGNVIEGGLAVVAKTTLAPNGTTTFKLVFGTPNLIVDRVGLRADART